MSTLLQDIEVGLHLDGWVWESLIETQALPEQSTPLKPIQGRNLYLYLAVSATTVSVTLIQEKDRRQLSIYYVSQAF